MRYFIFALFFVKVSSSEAFINIESLRQNIKTGFYGSSGASVGGASGNVDVFNVGANTQNIYKNDQREYLFIANYKYGEASNVKNNNKGSFHGRYAQGFAKGWWWEGFGQIEFNEFQSLTLRKVLGGGFRHCLFVDDDNSVFAGLGTFYEDENIDDDEDQANFRGNIYLSFRALMALNIETVLSAYYQPSFKTIDDYRLQGSAGLETTIIKSVSLVNSFNYAYDSRPPRTIEKQDLSYKVVLNFKY